MARQSETIYQRSPHIEDELMAAMPSDENEEEDLIIEELLAEEYAIIRN